MKSCPTTNAQGFEPLTSQLGIVRPSNACWRLTVVRLQVTDWQSKCRADCNGDVKLGHAFAPTPVKYSTQSGILHRRYRTVLNNFTSKQMSVNTSNKPQFTHTHTHTHTNKYNRSNGRSPVYMPGRQLHFKHTNFITSYCNQQSLLELRQ